MNFIKFLRDWTLPVSMLTGTVVYLIFAFTPGLAAASVVLEPVCDKLLLGFMFLVLFVTFCKVDFRRLRPVAWCWWTGLVQVVFVVAAVAVIIEFSLSGRSLILMEALLCCIICPCASAAPVVTAKLGGNLEQMTSYAFISNFITALLIPLFFPIIDRDVDITFWQAFTTILYEVCAVLILPILLAFVVKHTMHRFHRWVTGVKDLSYYLWGCSLMMVTGTTVRNIVHAQTTLWFLLAIASLGMLLCVVQFAVGRFIGHYCAATVEAGQGLGQKNTAFAIWVAYTYLNPLSSVGPGCYILWQNIINSVEIWMCRREGKERSA